MYLGVFTVVSQQWLLRIVQRTRKSSVALVWGHQKKRSARSRCELIQINVQRKMDLFHQFFLAELFLPLLPFIHNTRIHSSVPRRGTLSRAEIQCTHYAAKSIVSCHRFRWVAFVLFKCLHGTAWGLEDRYGPRILLQYNPSIPRTTMVVQLMLW